VENLGGDVKEELCGDVGKKGRMERGPCLKSILKTFIRYLASTGNAEQRSDRGP